MKSKPETELYSEEKLAILHNIYILLLQKSSKQSSIDSTEAKQNFQKEDDVEDLFQVQDKPSTNNEQSESCSV